MKITKFGHCCMLVEENGVRILLDPGAFTVDKHTFVTGLDAIVYTHEHADHYHLDSLQKLLISNPKALVLCNAGVATHLSQVGIPHEVIADGGTYSVKGVALEGHGATHAVIHESLPSVSNTGFLIAGRFWYPGDELTVDPGVRPDIMALPVSGPWMKFSEAIDYALKLKPQYAFAVHDLILHPQFGAFVPKLAGSILEPRGVRFFAIDLDKEYEF